MDELHFHTTSEVLADMAIRQPYIQGRKVFDAFEDCMVDGVIDIGFLVY